MRRRKLYRPAPDPARARDYERHLADATRNMAAMDSMPPEWRELVHEYGLYDVWQRYCGKVSLDTAARQLEEQRMFKGMMAYG